jgi:hypothetical protein
MYQPNSNVLSTKFLNDTGIGLLTGECRNAGTAIWIEAYSCLPRLPGPQRGFKDYGTWKEYRLADQKDRCNPRQGPLAGRVGTLRLLHSIVQL